MTSGDFPEPSSLVPECVPGLTPHHREPFESTQGRTWQGRSWNVPGPDLGRGETWFEAEGRFRRSHCGKVEDKVCRKWDADPH